MQADGQQLLAINLVVEEVTHQVNLVEIQMVHLQAQKAVQRSKNLKNTVRNN
jgi:hypothetical protein